MPGAGRSGLEGVSPHRSWSKCAVAKPWKLSMNRTPSSHPSPPVGEKVPEGRLRGIRNRSWSQCAAGPRRLFRISCSIYLAALLPPAGLDLRGAEIDASALPAAAKATIDFDRDV